MFQVKNFSAATRQNDTSYVINFRKKKESVSDITRDYLHHQVRPRRKKTHLNYTMNCVYSIQIVFITFYSENSST